MLISTKIHPPQLKSKLLHRKHLIQRLEDGKKSRLILITGPAGYGKTSLAGPSGIGLALLIPISIRGQK